MTLYRGLWQPPDCNPNMHEYHEELEAPIHEVSMLKDGEFVFPQELGLKAGWEQWEREELRRQVEESERQRRFEQERREAEARLLEQRRLAEAARATFRGRKPEIMDAYWKALKEDGIRLLEGHVVAVPYPHVYQRPPSEWQPLLAAFIQWAGVAFRLDQAVDWVWHRAGPNGPRYMRHEQANLAEFISYLAERKLIKARDTTWSEPLQPRKWGPSAQELGICIVCGAITKAWISYDSTYGVGKCGTCFPPA